MEDLEAQSLDFAELAGSNDCFERCPKQLLLLNADRELSEVETVWASLASTVLTQVVLVPRGSGALHGVGSGS